jgi:hypothetical protein
VLAVAVHDAPSQRGSTAHAERRRFALAQSQARLMSCGRAARRWWRWQHLLS